MKKEPRGALWLRHMNEPVEPEPVRTGGGKVWA